MTINLSFLSIGPCIRKHEGKLVARTSLIACVACLGLYYRRVTVDPKRAKVTITRRWLWFLQKKRGIPFRWIESIFYRYADLSANSDLPLAGKTLDHFIVGLRLCDQEEVDLFRFFGEGTFVNNSFWPDWLFWNDYLIDLSGTQEQESRAYVEVLGHLIGVPLIS